MTYPYAHRYMTNEEIDAMMSHYRKVIRRKPYKVRDPDWDEYKQKKTKAQQNADKTGCDWGLLMNPVFGTFEIFPLSRARMRLGRELRCAVFECSYPDRKQPGHGGKPDDSEGNGEGEGWLTESERIRTLYRDADRSKMDTIKKTKALQIYNNDIYALGEYSAYQQIGNGDWMVGHVATGLALTHCVDKQDAFGLMKELHIKIPHPFPAKFGYDPTEIERKPITDVISQWIRTNAK